MSNIAMTVGDYALIMEAEKCRWDESDKVYAMINKAVSQEAKKRLREIHSYMHHREEAMCGNL